MLAARTRSRSSAVRRRARALPRACGRPRRPAHARARSRRSLLLVARARVADRRARRGYLFSAHMLQHLLLVLVVPPLALLGAAARRASAPAAAPRLDAPRRSSPGRWASAPCGSGTRRTLCNAAVTSDAGAARSRELSLLAMGARVLVADPRAARRAIACRRSPAVALPLHRVRRRARSSASSITFSPVEVCSAFAPPGRSARRHAAHARRMGPDRAQSDQQIGGLLMWVPACLVYGAGILGVLARFYGASTHAAASDRGRHERGSVSPWPRPSRLEHTRKPEPVPAPTCVGRAAWRFGITFLRGASSPRSFSGGVGGASFVALARRTGLERFVMTREGHPGDSRATAPRVAAGVSARRARRRFLARISVGLGAVHGGGAMAVPLVGFIVAPLFRRVPTTGARWARSTTSRSARR